MKSNGVDYDDLRPEDMVVMDLEGNWVEVTMNPSSDTATHLELYKAFLEAGGIVHTHSPPYADYFYGKIPCAGNLTAEEFGDGYEKNTGNVIVGNISHFFIDKVSAMLAGWIPTYRSADAVDVCSG